LLTDALTWYGYAMLELLIAIGFNVIVGVLTTLLIYFYWNRRKRGIASQVDADTALGLFRDHFPEATGTATLTTDRRNALIDLSDGPGVGLLQGHGHRWNAHMLRPGDVASVRVAQDTTLQVRFADFGSPRASLMLADANERALWLTRLQALTRDAAATRRGDISHA
jgi:hypothetical protein